MKNEKLFEAAVRNKFRFQYKGIISTEDLWDLSVSALDVIFKDLNKQIKQVKEESLLDVKTKQDEELEVKIAIIKYIVAEKLDDVAKKSKAKEVREQKQKILSILANKKDESLESKTPEELEKMLAELEG